MSTAAVGCLLGLAIATGSLACGGGGGAIDGAAPDGSLVDAASIDVASSDASPPDAPVVDAAPPDAFSCGLDNAEPNETESFAFPRGNFSDCDDDGPSMIGIAAGTADIDYFRFSVSDDACSDPLPGLTVAPGAGIELCFYFQCTAGGFHTLTCAAGSTPSTSPLGRAGCCGASSVGLDALDCPSPTDDSVDVFVRVVTTQPATCVSYTVTSRP